MIPREYLLSFSQSLITPGGAEEPPGFLQILRLIIILMSITSMVIRIWLSYQKKSIKDLRRWL